MPIPLAAAAVFVFNALVAASTAYRMYRIYAVAVSLAMKAAHYGMVFTNVAVNDRTIRFLYNSTTYSARILKGGQLSLRVAERTARGVRFRPVDPNTAVAQRLKEFARSASGWTSEATKIVGGKPAQAATRRPDLEMQFFFGP